MRFAKVQKALSFALAVVSAAPLMVSGEIGLVSVIGFAALCAAGWAIEPPFAQNRRYRKIVTGAIIALMALQLARAAGGGAPLAKMGMEFSLMLLGVKLCTRGSSADYQQIAMLSFLQVIASTIALNDLFYAACFLIFVAVCPPMLALTQLRSEMEKRFGSDPSPESGAMLARLLRSKRIVSPGFVAGSALLSLPILLITAVLFITFPRMGIGLMGRLKTNDSIAGFTDEVVLGDIDLIRQRDTVMMRLEPLVKPARPPLLLPIKLRGAVFDHYEKDTWKQSDKRWRSMPRKEDDYALESAPKIDRESGFEVLLESMDPPILFVPGGTGQITTYPVSAGARMMHRRFEHNSYGMIRYQDDARVGIRYRVYLTGAEVYRGYESWQRDENRYLQLPKESGRLIALAREMAGNGTDAEKAGRLMREIRKRYQYSTSLSGSEANALARTPLDRFLFTRKTGTCEHFATALTLMLRAVGVQSRTVTGFSRAYWNPVGEFYAVLQRSAHSWTEAYIDGRWVTLDATPSAEGGEDPFRRSTLTMILDALRMRWHKHVVGYDLTAQMELAVDLRRFWIHTFPHGRRANEIPRWPLWILLGAAGIGAAGYWFWMNRRVSPRAAAPFRPKSRHASEATRLYVELDRKLARFGRGRAVSQTPKEQAESLEREASSLAGVARAVIERYCEVRFGEREFGEGEVERLRNDIRAMEQDR